MQSVKVLRESYFPRQPPPRSLSSDLMSANSLSLSNNAVYDEFNSFSAGKRAGKRKEVAAEETRAPRQTQSDSKKKEKKRAADMDTSK